MDTLVWIGIVLLVAGFVLIGIEMAAPGFGAPGIAGIICLVAGVFLVTDSLEEGILVTVVVIVILGILMAVIMGLMHYRKFRSPIILDTALHSEGAALGASDLDYLLDREGIAATNLRPAGKGDFDGIELDVVSEGVYIEKGSPIVIHRISSNRLVVKGLKEKRDRKG
ncbi:MAG: serine protease [Blautia sp.]|nr:serine protease [Blautia sp.]